MVRYYLKVFFIVLLFSGFSAKSAEPVCDLRIPFCQYNYNERSVFPESLLHDPVPLELLAPQTDIFLDFKIEAKEGIREKYSYVDPKNEIAKRPLEMALSYYDKLKDEIKKPEYLGVINYKERSTLPRFYVIDMKTGAVEKMLVAHGEGSDPKDTGYASIFSNRDNSHMSSLGAFITAETYNGKNGLSLRVDGIENTNSKMRPRAVVIHGSDYVNSNYNPLGMSWGCPAVNRKSSSALINKIKNGVLFLSWYNQ
jgi:hypothetical protein